MVIQTWRRFFKKTTISPGELKTYADNDQTVITVQQLQDGGISQTVGKAE